MHPLYRSIYMRVWMDALCNGFTTNDARALADMEATEAVRKEGEIREANRKEDGRDFSCVCKGERAECVT